MLTLVFATLLTLVPPQQASPDISCPTQVWDNENKLFRGSEGCILKYEDMQFETDWLTFDKSTGDVTAGDHIHFKRGAEKIDGSRMEMNINIKAGKIWDATGNVEPGFHVTAKVAERFADQSWEFHNARLTACDSKPPCWTISQGLSWYHPGDWVKGRSTVFRFHDVPVFWLPYVVAPSEQKERSTGFLIPSISKSNSKGWGFRDEFFYAINDSADASFVGEYYTDAGATGEITFRARPTSTGYINVNSFVARDKLNPDIEKKNDIGHSLRILSFSNLGQHSRAVVDLETESSETFRQLWGDSFNVIASPINRSVGFLTTNKPESSFNLLYSRSEFLQTVSSTTGAPVRTALRKFPSVEVSIPSRELFGKVPVYFRFEGSVSGTSRRDELITTPTFGGRFDFHPSLEIPILRLNAFEFSQEIGARETEYSHSLGPDVQQDALNRFTIDYAAHFSGPVLDKSYGKWRHSIQPTVDYRYVTGAERFRETIIVDDVDLVADTSEVEYGITNRIIGSREFLSWRVAQVEYFNQSFGGAIRPGERNVFDPLLGLTGYSFADGKRHFSPIVSTLRLSPKPGNTLDLQLDFDTQLHKLRSAAFISGLRRKMWGTNILYAFTGSSALQAANNQLHGTLSYGNGLNRGFSFSTNFSYDVQHRLFQGTTTQLGYNTECYGLSVEFTDFNLGNRQEHKLRFALSLKNIGTFGNMRRQDRVF